MSVPYERYKKLLQKNNVTTYRVCKDGKISTTIMSNWKMGYTSPSIPTLEKLSKYFKVPMSYFLEDK